MGGVGEFGQERGTTAIEYAIIAGLIAVVIAASIAIVGTSLGNVFSNIANQPFW
jgi:pilus assembly protein Flp/PilA